MTAQQKLLLHSEWHFDSGREYEKYASDFGTPFFLYDANMIRNQAKYVRNTFHDLVAVYFAVKANPNLKLLESIRDSVDGLDISSVGELEQALLAGYDPACMSFAGPAKTVEELGRAIELEVGSISVESERELRDIIVIADSVGKRANVTLRVNPETDSRAFGLKMGGRPLQFGIDEENIEPVVKSLIDHRKEVNFRGLHIYAGSQGFEFADLANSLRNTLDIAHKVEVLYGSEVSRVNLGGGFGISHVPSSRELDLAALADAITPDFEQFLCSRGEGCELIFELGRYLVADAGIYVVRVIGTKESRGQFFAITDGGLHHHLAAAGNFGAGFRSNYPVVNISRPSAAKIDCNIVGPSCNPTDLLGQGTRIAEPREGDLIAVLSSGSYGYSASPILFLGRPTPAEIVRNDGVSVLGRICRTIVDFN